MDYNKKGKKKNELLPKGWRIIKLTYKIHLFLNFLKNEKWETKIVIECNRKELGFYECREVIKWGGVMMHIKEVFVSRLSSWLLTTTTK